MKIIKEIISQDYYKNYLGDLNFETEEEFEEASKNGYWLWGLGADGDLYCKCSDFEDPNDWYLYDVISCPPLVEMKKIVKAFGHLLVFT